MAKAEKTAKVEVKPESKAPITKEGFLEKYTERLTAMLGRKVSKQVAWDLFKMTQILPFHIAVEENNSISLAGVGRYTILTSARTGNRKHIKYYGSTALSDKLMNGEALLAPIEVEAPVVETKEAPKAPKAEKEAPVVEDIKVEEIQEIDEDDDI